MTFMHPEFLYFMLPPVLILFVLLLTQKEHLADFFAPEIIAKLRVHSKRMGLKARNILFLLMSVLLVIALAQPVIEQGKVKVQAKSADIVIALDISDSMLAEDMYPNRLKHSKQKILDFVALSPKERIGVMAFAKASYLVSPLSFDFRAVRYLVDQLRPSYITEKGTDFKQLLNNVGEMMAEKDQKYLLLFTDGGDQENFEDEIELAKSLGITVFVMGVGTDKGAPIKTKEGGFIKQDGSIIISKLNEAIADLATKTGGSYIQTLLGNEDIEAMLGEIRAKTTQKVLAEEEIMQYEQLFYFPLGLAMLLLLLATSSMSERKNVHVPHLFVLAGLLYLAQPSHAGLLDFMSLGDAKAAYEAEDFKASADAYKKIDNSYARYGEANALYKQGRYAEAAGMYDTVQFENSDAEFNRLHNLGNAYAKQGSPDSLKKAAESYEKALKIKDEKPTRENLETVKKRLQQQKNEDKSDDQKSDKDQKEGSQNQGDKQKDPNGDESRQKKQQKSQQQSSQNDSDKGTKHQKQQQQQGSQQQGKEQQQPPKVQGSEEQQYKSTKDDDLKKEQVQEGDAAAAQASEQMSDLEAKKWFKILNERPAGHIYQIGKESKQEESENAKPW